MACADFGRRAIILNFSRSASTISRGFLGRPVRMPKYGAASQMYPYRTRARLVNGAFAHFLGKIGQNEGLALFQENAKPAEGTAARQYRPGFSRSPNPHAF